MKDLASIEASLEDDDNLDSEGNPEDINDLDAQGETPIGIDDIDIKGRPPVGSRKPEDPLAVASNVSTILSNFREHKKINGKNLWYRWDFTHAEEQNHKFYSDATTEEGAYQNMCEVTGMTYKGSIEPRPIRMLKPAEHAERVKSLKAATSTSEVMAQTGMIG